MSHAPKAMKMYIDGPTGRLEAILETPGNVEPCGAAVVCHPHPQHGGTMHNKVVHTIARAFVRAGFSALRFNFRGTEQSDGEYDSGEGEVDDARAALAWMQASHPDLPLWLAGFSFGAAIAVRAAAGFHLHGLISVAPAVGRFVGALEQQPDCPWLIVQGDADELVDVDTTIAWINEIEPGPELLVLPGVEHFFHGKLNELRDAVMAFIAANR